MSSGWRDAGRRWPLPEGHLLGAELRGLAAGRSGDRGVRASSVGTAEVKRPMEVLGCQLLPPPAPVLRPVLPRAELQLAWTLAEASSGHRKGKAEESGHEPPRCSPGTDAHLLWGCKCPNCGAFLASHACDSESCHLCRVCLLFT